MESNLSTWEAIAVTGEHNRTHSNDGVRMGPSLKRLQGHH